MVGAGTVGALTAWLCARLPGTEVTLVDVNPDRAALAAALGCGFAGAGGGAGGLRPHDPRQRQRRGAGDGAGRGGAGGDGGGGELVRRPAADGGARGRVPQPAAPAGLEPGEPGADRAAGALEQPAADGGGAGAARGSGARRADLRRDRVPRPGRRATARSWTGRTRSAIVSSTTEGGGHVRRRGPRPHHDRPQPAGARCSGRRRACTARPSWWTRRSSPRRSTRNGIVVDIGLATEVLARGAGAAALPQPRRAAGVRGPDHHDRGAQPAHLRRAGGGGPRRAARRTAGGCGGCG